MFGHTIPVMILLFLWSDFHYLILPNVMPWLVPKNSKYLMRVLFFWLLEMVFKMVLFFWLLEMVMVINTYACCGIAQTFSFFFQIKPIFRTQKAHVTKYSTVA